MFDTMSCGYRAAAGYRTAGGLYQQDVHRWGDDEGIPTAVESVISRVKWDFYENVFFGFTQIKICAFVVVLKHIVLAIPNLTRHWSI